MGSAQLLPVPIQQFFDVDGLPLAGGKIYSWVAGTSTPQALYTDSGLSVPYSNPIILDAYGRVGPMYMVASPAYKISLTDASTVTQPGWPVDDVTAPQTQAPAVTGFLPGMMVDWPTSTAPSGWLLCDGSGVNRVTYADLFAVTGTTYGSGNGSTTFNVPDFRGRSRVGAGTGSGLTPRALGATGGEELHVLVTGELAQHTHGVTDPTHTHTFPVYDAALDIGSAANHSAVGNSSQTFGAKTVTTAASATGITLANAGSNTGHNTMHPFGVASVIIKT